MTLKVALGIDAFCWVISTLAIYLWVSQTAALFVGVFALGYLAKSVRTMLQIIKVEQIMQADAMRHYPFEDADFDEIERP